MDSSPRMDTTSPPGEPGPSPRAALRATPQPLAEDPLLEPELGVLPPVDEDHRNLLAKTCRQRRAGVDVDELELERDVGAHPLENCSSVVAEVAPFPREQFDEHRGNR